MAYLSLSDDRPFPNIDKVAFCYLKLIVNEGMKLLFFLLRNSGLPISSELSRSSRISYSPELASRISVPVIPSKTSNYTSGFEVTLPTRFVLSFAAGFIFTFSAWLEFPFATRFELTFPSVSEFSFPTWREFFSFPVFRSIIASFCLFFLFSFSLLTLELFIFSVDNLIFAELAFQRTVVLRYFDGRFQPYFVKAFIAVAQDPGIVVKELVFQPFAYGPVQSQ